MELALTLPIVVGLLLAGAELGFAFARQHVYQVEADVLATWAAENGFADWDRVVRTENERTGCDGLPGITWPDGQRPGGRIVVDLRCTYRPVVLPGLISPAIRVQSEAVSAR